MRSLSVRELCLKEWRELLASRAYWLMLLMIGPLVGQAFITAVRLYAEASGSGGPAALPQGLTPLDGILAPTFGAYDLAATFLLPFVAIRFISAEKQSGALKLLLQLPGSLGAKVFAKGLVILGAWVAAWIPGLLAIVLWKSYGGHLHTAEVLNLLLGHLLRGMLSAGIAVAAAALAESAASAAIVTLGFTVGSWALDFVAAGRGGWLQQLANYTPTSALRFFEQGLLRLSTVVGMLAIIFSSFAIASIWLHTGRTLRQRLLATVSVVLLLGVVMFGSTRVRASWDVSENRRNSFSRADEAALRKIQEPLRVTVILAPEDPRLTDFEQNVARKLRRNLAQLEVNYVANSQTGLFETGDDHYGEIWYEMRGQKVMDRSTIEQVVLEQIYQLAGVSPPATDGEVDFPGYPLAARPKWAALIFYGVWPLITISGWWLSRRQ
ncbi:MAG TPA: ABC transporter permease subunit [Pyrinomonadaceae bacterium]|nr:ABC transporter permease subunit [Pyrinomonadaceae bacterium]